MFVCVNMHYLTNANLNIPMNVYVKLDYMENVKVKNMNAYVILINKNVKVLYTQFIKLLYVIYVSMKIKNVKK